MDTQDYEPKRNKDDLSEHLGRHVDDRRCKGDGRRDAPEDRCARAKHDSA
jgi:hypothetical protein